MEMAVNKSRTHGPPLQIDDFSLFIYDPPDFLIGSYKYDFVFLNPNRLTDFILLIHCNYLSVDKCHIQIRKIKPHNVPPSFRV